MSKAIAKKETVKDVTFEAIEKVLITGDLTPLTPQQRVEYYNAVCKAVGLNPLTKPFDYIKLNGNLVLYANKGCAEQLRENKEISLRIKDAKQVGDVYIVVAEASNPKGRVDSSTGAVSIKGLSGNDLANAVMKCETKAKRRVTLSICSLNMLDETETADISDREALLSALPDAAPSSPKIEPKVIPAATAGPTRASVGKEISRLAKKCNMDAATVTEWAKEFSGKESITDMTLEEMIDFHATMEREYYGPEAGK